MYLGKKGNTEFGLGESVVLSLCKSLKDTNCYVYFDNFFTSPTLMAKLLENGIYGIGTVRANRKHMPTLKQDKQMKRGEHDWQACQSLSATKWMDNKSVILLSNYHDPRSVRDIDRRVKGSKEKVKISCPTVIHEYNQHMGGVDFCDQMKVSYQVDRRSKFRFYLRIVFDFLDIGVVNSKIIYGKMDSTAGMSAMDFRFSLARSLIGKFSNRKRTVPVHRPLKNLKATVLTLLIICLSFPLHVLVVLYVPPRRLRIAHLFAVCLARLHCVYKKTETVFIYTILSKKIFILY